MRHPIHQVTSYQIMGPYTIRVCFADGAKQDIDFQPVLKGALFGPLRDLTLFNQVKLDPEAHTLVWTNGADFDPATLHDWPAHGPELARRAKEWGLQPA